MSYFKHACRQIRVRPGMSLIVNGQPLRIVGVAPASFPGNVQGYRPDVYVPFTLRWVMQPTVDQDTESRGSFWLYLFGRLAPRVSVGQAAAALNAIYQGILAEVEAPLLTDLPDERRSEFLAKRIELTDAVGGRASALDHHARRGLLAGTARFERRADGCVAIRIDHISWRTR